MNKAEKKERRQARHELRELFRQQTILRMGLFSTEAQIEREVSTQVDRCIKGEIPPPQPIPTLEARAEFRLADVAEKNIAYVLSGCVWRIPVITRNIACV